MRTLNIQNGEWGPQTIKRGPNSNTFGNHIEKYCKPSSQPVLAIRDFDFRTCKPCRPFCLREGENLGHFSKNSDFLGLVIELLFIQREKSGPSQDQFDPSILIKSQDQILNSGLHLKA